MTYLKLRKWLEAMPERYLECDVTIYCKECDEYFPAWLTFEPEDDVLDKGHPYLTSGMPSFQKRK